MIARALAYVERLAARYADALRVNRLVLEYADTGRTGDPA